MCILEARDSFVDAMQPCREPRFARFSFPACRILDSVTYAGTCSRDRRRHGIALQEIPSADV